MKGVFPGPNDTTLTSCCAAHGRRGSNTAQNTAAAAIQFVKFRSRQLHILGEPGGLIE